MIGVMTGTALSLELREYLLREVDRLPEPIMCPLSSGVDSHSILFACLEAGKDVVTASFMLDGVLSTDFKVARKTACDFGVEFRPVILPRGLNELERDVNNLIHNYGTRKKVDIECVWPFLYLAELCLDCECVSSGYFTGVYFGLSKNAALSGCKTDVVAFDAMRDRRFSQLPNKQTQALDRVFACPVNFLYTSRECFEMFQGRTWNALNKPQEKQPIRLAFSEYFARAGVKTHINLQLGSSKIAAHFETLLDSARFNPDNKFTGVTALYNDIAKHGQA